MTDLLLCFSHMRWSSAYQRPQQLMSRFTGHTTVLYFEEPLYDAPYRYNEIKEDENTGVIVITPHVPYGAGQDGTQVEALLELFMESIPLGTYTAWYDTPMAFEYSSQLEPSLVVYDRSASPTPGTNPEVISKWESELLKKADLVFTTIDQDRLTITGGCEAIHSFPNGGDPSSFETSWDDTCKKMTELMDITISANKEKRLSLLET